LIVAAIWLSGKPLARDEVIGYITGAILRHR
jgi:hypothetical protein